MTSLLRGVVNWLDGSTERLQENENCADLSAERDLIEGTADRRDYESNVEATEIYKDVDFDETAERNSKAAIKEDLMEVSMKAVHAAKEWGGYLYSLGKMTGGQVTRTAGYLKSALDVQLFADDAASSTENQLAGRRSSGGSPVVAPWVGYSESEAMKSQILALSKDRENFLRGPPPGVDFNFNYPVNHPLAQVMLEQDPNLKMMRFELVPKQVREETFWQNYFYRVSLIKQSAQLTTLAKQTVICRPSSVNRTIALNTEDVDQQHYDVLNDCTGQIDEPDLDDFELVSAADVDTAE